MKNICIHYSFPSMIKTKTCYFSSFLPISAVFAIFAIFALFWRSLRYRMAPFSLFLTSCFHAYLDLESYNQTAHISDVLLSLFSMIKQKNCDFCLFLPIFAYFFLSLRHIKTALLNSWQYNSRFIFWLPIFGHNQIPGHFISLFPNFPSFLKQNLQPLKPAVERQSAK